MSAVEPLLRVLVARGGSDLHCKVGAPPRVRVDGLLRHVQTAKHTAADTEAMLREVLPADLVEQFGRDHEAEFAYSVAGLGRFRVSAFRSLGAVRLVFRLVAIGATPLRDLGLPDVLGSLASEQRGLLLVTGPSGAGKTTTLAAMVEHINASREVHIVTVEDPVEVLHVDKRAMISQREVRLDTGSFASALRAALRQDPDVIMLGELRDSETAKVALTAAETGHFVMTTLHTTNAQETVNRFVDFFPPHEQQQVRLSLAGALRGVVCQRLVPRKSDGGRCAAMEILVNTGRVADAITDREKTSTLGQLVAEGGYYGMQTFDQHLLALISEGVISREAAIEASTSPHDLDVELRRLGMVA